MADQECDAGSKVSRPILVQSSAEPVCRGEDANADDVRCGKCGHLLIKQYPPGSLLDVAIECFRCHSLFEFPKLGPGEPLSRPLVAIGNFQRRFIKGTIILRPGVILASQEQVDIGQALTRARPPSSSSLNLSSVISDALASLDSLTEGAFGKRMKSALRAKQSGALYFAECPLAWALTHLDQSRRAASDFGRTDDLMALTFLHGWHQIRDGWSHSPRFSFVAKAACNEFLHTFFVMIAASYLSEHGNSVGIDIAADPTSLRPDLYLSPTLGKKLFLEGKALRRVNYPESPPPDSALPELFEGAVKKAGKQISSSRPGALILGSMMLQPNWTDRFSKAAKIAMERIGPKKRSLCALVAISAEGGTFDRAASRFDPPQFKVGVALNPHYMFENPISTEKSEPGGAAQDAKLRVRGRKG